MKCREFIETVMDYTDGSLSEQQLVDFQRHMRDCAVCIDYLKSYEQCVRFGRTAGLCADQDTPDTMPEDLVQAIRAARQRMK